MTEQPLKAVILPVTPFQQNCSLVWCTRTHRAALVDPGGEVPRLIAAVAEQGLRLEKILLTHGHLDHAGGANALRRETGVPIEGPHPDDQFLLDRLAEDCGQFGWAGEACISDRYLAQGDEVQVGEATFWVRHCPGHTPGHVVFFHPGVKVALVGDVLFRGSIGRTDFPRGNHQQLLSAITERLWPLGDDVRFVPGHGPMSTFGHERKTNPFVSDAVLASA
ncbi:MAG: MBL fold metallo-hydrolase [Rhizomicrobium sp.]